jgi:CysZ protein
MGQLRRIAQGAAAAPKRIGIGFFSGLRYPFRGMRFVYGKHIGLVRFWLPPIVLTGIMLVLIFGAVFEYHDALTDWIWTAPAGESFWSSVGRFFHGLLDVLLSVMLALGGLVAVMLSTSVLAAPFNDALSAEVERLVTGAEGPPFRISTMLRDLLRTVGMELVKLFLYALVMLPLFLASLLLPVAGQVLYSVFGFLFTAMYFALDYIDWPATRRGRGVGARLELGRKRFMPMFGFGTGVWIFLFIPFVNLFFMPAAVAGGTLLFLDLEAQEGGHDQDSSVPTEPSAEAPSEDAVEPVADEPVETPEPTGSEA